MDLLHRINSVLESIDFLEAARLGAENISTRVGSRPQACVRNALSTFEQDVAAALTRAHAADSLEFQPYFIPVDQPSAKDYQGLLVWVPYLFAAHGGGGGTPATLGEDDAV